VQICEGFLEFLIPSGLDFEQIGVIGLEHEVAAHAEAILFVEQDIDRRSDRRIRTHGRIHRYQRAQRRLLEAGLAGDDAIEDRLALLDLADLLIRILGRGHDEVAFRVDHEHLMVITCDLSPSMNEALASKEEPALVCTCFCCCAELSRPRYSAASVISCTELKFGTLFCLMSRLSCAITDCVVARFPAVSTTKARSPSIPKVNILV